jgi:hypothetical protein
MGKKEVHVILVFNSKEMTLSEGVWEDCLYLREGKEQEPEKIL